MDYLMQRSDEQSDRGLKQAAARLSANVFAIVWENPEDAVYETL